MDTVSSRQSNLQSSALLFPLRRERHLSISFRLKKVILGVGDLLFLNLALFVSLTVREFDLPELDRLVQHVVVFNCLHAVWVLIFYSAGLYDIHLLAVSKTLERKLVQGFGIAGAVTIVLFYSFTFVGIQPKTILVMDLTLSAVFLLAWRKWFIGYNRNGPKARILLCGRRAELDQFEVFSDRNQLLGYEVSRPPVLWDGTSGVPADMILDRLRADRVDLLAITRKLSEDPQTRGLSYQLVCAGVPVIEFSRLAEEFTGKIPVSVINESWFLENLAEFNKLGFETFKRILDVIAAVLLGAIAILLSPFIAIAIKLDSEGAIFFRQRRTGKGGSEFDLIKFRTMRQDAEAQGAQWATEKDSRITRVGGFMRKTRIDELPQVWNVIKGEMSLVGPRPERPEFVQELSQNIPFYGARHLVKPGLTGWAQINFRYGASVDDAMEKLQHDLYYIKNRSVSLELSILLKTFGTVLRYEGH